MVSLRLLVFETAENFADVCSRIHGTILLGEWAMIALAAFFADKAATV